MGMRKAHDKAIFAWQAVLILLPVLILAGVGFSFLRQDRALVRHEAEARAQELLKEPGVAGLIAKPFAMNRLLEKIKECVPGIESLESPRR